MVTKSRHTSSRLDLDGGCDKISNLPLGTALPRKELHSWDSQRPRSRNVSAMSPNIRSTLSHQLEICLSKIAQGIFQLSLQLKNAQSKEGNGGGTAC